MAQLEREFARIDINGDGQITAHELEEFFTQRLMNQISEQDKQQLIGEVFASMDKDGD